MVDCLYAGGGTSTPSGNFFEELLVHGDFLAVCVEVPYRQFHSFTHHHSQGQPRDAEFGCNSDRFAYEIAIVYKSLRRKFRIEIANIFFAFGSRIDDNTASTCSTCHFHLLTNGTDESFGRKGFHNTAGTDDGDSAYDTQPGVESTCGDFFTSGN